MFIQRTLMESCLSILQTELLSFFNTPYTPIYIRLRIQKWENVTNFVTNFPVTSPSQE